MFSAGSMQVFDIKFVAIAFVSGFEASVWYPLLLPVFCKFSPCVPCLAAIANTLGKRRGQNCFANL